MTASTKTKILFASVSVAVMACFGIVFFINSLENELRLSDMENPIGYQGRVEEKSITTTKVPKECLSLVHRIVDRSGTYPRIWETSSLFEYDNFDTYQVRLVYGEYDKMFISECNIDNNNKTVKSFRILDWKTKRELKVLK